MKKNVRICIIIIITILLIGICCFLYVKEQQEPQFYSIEEFNEKFHHPENTSQ